jgi:ankyrin repeat protein
MQEQGAFAMAFIFNEMERAPGFENHDIMQTMLFQPKHPEESKRGAAFFGACEKGDLSSVQEMVTAHPEMLQWENFIGETALLKAAAAPTTDVAEYLLQQGMNVNHQAKDGRTPLLISTEKACDSDNYDMVTLLVRRYGAKTGIGDNLDRTPKAIALCMRKEELADALDQAEKGAMESRVIKPCHGGVTHEFKVRKPLAFKR